jgi:hypothetical protein
MAAVITVANVVDVICERFELENHDVLAYVKAMLACSSDDSVQVTRIKRMMPIKDCEGCLYDPVTRKLYSEIAVE